MPKPRKMKKKKRAGKQARAPDPAKRKFLSAILARAKRVGSTIVSEAKPKNTKNMSRREALVRMGVGAATLGATAFGTHKVAKKIPYWTGITHRNLLSVQFGIHVSRANAKGVIDAIEHAKKIGKPFHVFFDENAISNRTTMRKMMLSKSRYVKIVRIKYAELRRSGVSEEEAKNQLRTMLRTKYPDYNPFFIEVEMTLALNNILPLPIEAYSKEDLQFLKRHQRDREAQNSEIKKIPVGDLVALQNSLLNFAQRSYEVGEFRNTRIRKSIQSGEFFELARELYPQLKDVPQIRGLGHMGATHRNLIVDFNNKKSSVRFEEERFSPEFSLQRYVGFTVKNTRPINEREARVLAISSIFDSNVENLLKEGRRDLANKGYRKALNMSQKEFENLTRLITPFSNPSERSAIILNYLVGESYFTPR